MAFYRPDSEHVALLRAAIEKPFVTAQRVPRSAPISAWFRLACEEAPLWCFDRWAFHELRATTLPSSYPLSRIIGRIMKDEGIGRDTALPPLVENLIGRRVYLCDEVRLRPMLTARQPDDGTWTVNGSSSEALAHHHCVDKGTLEILDAPPGVERTHEVSEYWGIGGDLVELIEVLESSLSKRQRASHQKELDDYLDKIGTSLDPGRPVMGGPQEMLDELFRQGKWLLSVCWEALAEGAPDPRPRIIEVLSGLGEPTQDHGLWAVRLALPMLSVMEVRALIDEVALPLGKRRPDTPPRRFTVFSLARRLRTKRTTLAARLDPPSDVKHFRAVPNPISAAQRG